MFRENSDHLQFNILESVNWMDESLKNKLKNSWAPAFYEYVFCKIDEKPFHVLFSELGRPNAPVNVLLGLEIIKHMFDHSDDQLILEYNFNYLVSYSLGYRVLGKDNIGERTLYDFRERLYKYTLENPDEVDLVFKQFQSLLKDFVENSEINTDEQRMDSTAVMPNIAKAGRLGLIYNVMRNALKSIPDEFLSQKLIKAKTSDFKKDVLYKIKASETDKKIDQLLEVCNDIINLVDHSTSIDLNKNNEIKLLKRLLKEQCDYDNEKETIKARKKSEISSESLQSAYDEEATYRKKAGKGESGYSLNLSETCSEENDFQLITDYKLDKNTKADTTFIKERLPIIKENTDCEEMNVDGGYYSEDIAKEEEIKVNFSDMTGKKPSKNLLDIEIDKDDDLIIECPNGETPFMSKKEEGIYEAHFDIKVCEKCEIKSTCPVNIQRKKGVIKASEKSIIAAKTRNDIKVNRDTYVSKRAAIEGTNSELKRMHGMGKLRVRGKVKSSIVVGLKVISCNAKRFCKYITMKRNEKQSYPKITGEVCFKTD